MEKVTKQEGLVRRRENEVQKVTTSVREDQLAGSLDALLSCFGNCRKLLSEDMDRVEKTMKTARRARRHLRAKMSSRMRKAELELGDMLSSSSSCGEENGSSDRALRPQKRQLGKNSHIEEAAALSEERSHAELSDAPKPADLGNSEECDLPRMALGGVPLDSKGEPLELTVSGKWASEYDDDDANSLVRLSLPSTVGRKVPASLNLHITTRHTSTRRTPSPAVYPLFDISHDS